jgi:hypothetical protein
MADKFMKSEGFRYTQYYVQPTNQEKYRVPTAEVKVTKPHTKYYYNREFPNAGIDETPKFDRDPHHLMQPYEQKYGSNGYDDNGEPLDNHVPGQYDFFAVNHRPAAIDEMFAHHSMRHHLPTLLGIAANDAGWPTNPIEGSESLSEHSRPIVDRMVERGLLSPRQGGHYGNGISDSDPDWHDYKIDDDTLHMPAIPATEVAEGRKLFRNALRSKPPAGAGSSAMNGESVKGKQFDLWGK